MGSGQVQSDAGRTVARRPGGRTRDCTRRILDATIELIVEHGMPALTFQAVAERAGVGRATMYRRWDTSAHLAIDAIRARSADEIVIADHGSLREDLITLLEQIGRFIGSPVGRAAVIAGLQIGPSPASPGPAPSWSRRWQDIDPLFRRANQRNELASDTDIEALFAALAGAMYFRTQVIGQEVNRRWIERVVDAVIAPGAPRVSESSPRRRRPSP